MSEALAVQRSARGRAWGWPVILYAIAVVAWFVAGQVWGDRWRWLFVMNTFAPFLFTPLPVLICLAWRLRQRAVWVSVAVLVAMWSLLYGSLWLPSVPSLQAADTTLTVMSYNLLFLNDQGARVRDVVLEGDADLVVLQELTPDMATMIRQDLSVMYPYQSLDPHAGTRGMGVISRYPLEIAPTGLGSDWGFAPQVVSVDVGGREVLLIHVHLQPTTSLGGDSVARTVAERMRQVRAVNDFVEIHPGALLLAGDFNSTPQNAEHAVLSRSLHDAWQEAGVGFGHTWPVWEGRFVPRLVRIDYVWHSDAFHALRAELGRSDGASDHRPLLVTLNWR